MKILMVSHEYPPIGGGGANACMFLAREYAKCGHAVTVLTVGFGTFEPKEVAYEGNLVIYRIKAKRNRKEHCSFIEMLDYLLKAIPVSLKLEKENDFDICQVFFGIPSGPIGYILKKRFRLPYVIRIGGGDIPGFQSRFKFLYKLLSPPLKLIWKKADAIIANSEGMKNFSLKFYSRCKIDVITNGVDIDFFCPAEKKRDETGIVQLLFVSRLIERKGLQDLIPHLKEIEESAKTNIHLTIVGDGPYRSALEALTHTCGADEYVTFVGQTEKKDLPQYYQNSDLFVFPSHREGMPNVVLEAMASGLPIVMRADCEGSKELVDTNGVLVINGEIQSAVIKILSLNASCLRDMENRSRQKAVEVFAWTSIAEQYVKAFVQIINGKEQ